MSRLNPINQTKLYGLNKYMNEFVFLENQNKFPKKILFTGQKGIGKSTLAYHYINYVLSKDGELCYDLNKYEIDVENSTYRTISNGSNPNLFLIDLEKEKKFIDINQVRDLILKLNKSSFNLKPRFILIDNIEFLNLNSINALLKIIEEPTENTYFILINNSSKRLIPTLSSRCINYKISISNNESLEISKKLLNGELSKKVNRDILNYYATPGFIYNVVQFSRENNYNLQNVSLKELLVILIEDKQYKNRIFSYIFFDLIEFYFRKIFLSFDNKIIKKYEYFIKRMSNMKKFNLDEETLFLELRDELLNE